MTFKELAEIQVDLLSVQGLMMRNRCNSLPATVKKKLQINQFFYLRTNFLAHKWHNPNPELGQHRLQHKPWVGLGVSQASSVPLWGGVIPVHKHALA